MLDYILLCVLIATASVNCQLDADQVYQLLSNRIHVENTLMRNQLKTLEEKIDSKESHLNTKIDSLSSRIGLLERNQGRTLPNQDTNREDTDDGEDQTNELDNIRSEITIMRQAFNSEKTFARKVESFVRNKTDFLTERHRAFNDRLGRAEEEIQRIDETAGIKYTDSFDRMLEQINETQDKIEGKLETLSQKQNLLDQDLKSQKEELETDQDDLNSKIKQILIEQKSQNTTIEDNRLSLNQIVNTVDQRKIAFYAYLSATQEFDVGSKIVFDRVFLQEGDGYSSNTGVFTCPVSGVYMFSVVLANDNSNKRDLVAVFKINSQIKTNILSQRYHQYQRDQSSIFVIYRLNKGSTVWVEIYFKSATVQKNRSTFAGALLYTY